MRRPALLALAALIGAGAALPADAAAPLYKPGAYYGTTLVLDAGTNDVTCFTIKGSKMQNVRIGGILVFPSLTITKGKVSGTAKGITLKGGFLGASRFGGTLKRGTAKANALFARPRTAADVSEGRCA